jgi:hypothetical protein
MATASRKPLAFHTVSFGEDAYSASLRQMASAAKISYSRAPSHLQDLALDRACGYHDASMGTVGLTNIPHKFLCSTDSVVAPAGRDI